MGNPQKAPGRRGPIPRAPAHPGTLTASYTGEKQRDLELFLRPHIDVYGSRPIRDGLKIRYGVTWLPLPWLPFMVQPTVMGAWEFCHADKTRYSSTKRRNRARSCTSVRSPSNEPPAQPNPMARASLDSR